MSPVETDSQMDRLRQARKLVLTVLEEVPAGELYNRYFLSLEDVADAIELAMDHHDALEGP